MKFYVKKQVKVNEPDGHLIEEFNNKTTVELLK